MQLSELLVYPVKSCAGIAVTDWPLDARGLRHDRSLMVVDARSGVFLTQREIPALALVRPSLHGGALRLTTPGGSTDLRLDGPPGPTRRVTVWEHTGPATDCGEGAAILLSDHVRRDVRIVAVPRDHERTAESQYAGPDVAVGFSDGYPLLLIGAASLEALNSRLPSPLPMNRFRPNLVVTGAAPFAEDGWDSIRVGEALIDIVKPCARCAITTVDQSTGIRSGAEPLRALGTFRRGDRGVMFGQNAVHRSLGTLRVGDDVQVAALK